ncbi:MAG: hypothetical protein K6F09_04805 [Clostridiales bacterium]|nr:hypothetical protein [Clostridiales bacterium]
MIKGVNHQVVEITQTGCEYFDRVLFFVKPEFASVSEGTLRDRAEAMSAGAGAPPPTKLKKNKWIFALKIASALCVGVIIGGAAVFFF